MNISEKSAYIKGLIEGLDLDNESKEAKVIKAMAELLEALCLNVEELEDSYDELCGQVDEIDEDLGLLEEDFYDLGEGCGCGDDCHCHGDDDDLDDFDGDFDDDSCYFEVTCPTCGDTVELNEAMIDEGFINCPGCGEFLEFDFSEIDEDEEVDTQ